MSLLFAAVISAFLPIGPLAVAHEEGASSLAIDVWRQELAPLIVRSNMSLQQLPLPPLLSPAPVPLMCSSIGCPSGYIPVTNHETTKCFDGACTVDQCCDATCAGFDGCPDGHAPTWSKGQELCHDGICTSDQCCQSAPSRCTEIECPMGLVPVDEAWEVECLDGECDIDQCCDMMCTSYACPDGYVLLEDAAYRFCANDICTTDLCCDGAEEEEAAPRQDQASPSLSLPSSPPTFCKGFECPSGYQLMLGVDNVECFDQECERDECCEEEYM